MQGPNYVPYAKAQDPAVRKAQDPEVRKAYSLQDPTLRKKPEKLFYNREGGKYAVKFCKPITNGELIAAIMIADMGLEQAKATYTKAYSFASPIVINGSRLKASSSGPKNKALMSALAKLCDT